MKSDIGPLRITVSGAAHASASIASVVAALEASPQVRELLLEGGLGSLILGDDVGDLLIVKPIDSPAAGAFVLECLQILPSDRYLELASAIVRDRENEISLEIRHGWPILSVVSAHSTVADAGGATSLSGESAALCTVCDHPLTDVAIRACSVRDCPNAQKDAA